jgi:uncharacterized protein
MVLAAAAAFAGAAVQSATGFGFALILGPALFATLDPYEAITALLVLGLALNLLVLLDRERPEGLRWGVLGPLLLAALPGLGLGAAVLGLLSKAALQVAVGVAVIGAALLQWRAPVPGGVREPSLRSACAVGLASGALTTSTSISGPPIVLWLQAHGTPPAEQRAFLAVCFLGLNVAGAAVLFGAGGDGDAAGAGVLLPLLALVALGHGLGLWLFRRLDPRRFRPLVLAVIVAAGVASVGAGLAAAL